MRDKNKSELPIWFWNRMENNPGYIIMMKMGYNGKSGLDREGKGRLRPLQQQSKETPVVEVPDTLFFEFRREPEEFFVSNWRKFKVAKEWQRYRKWFRDMNEDKMNDIMAHRYARFRYNYHFHDKTYLFELISLLDKLYVEFNKI